MQFMGTHSIRLISIVSILLMARPFIIVQDVLYCTYFDILIYFTFIYTSYCVTNMHEHILKVTAENTGNGFWGTGELLMLTTVAVVLDFW